MVSDRRLLAVRAAILATLIALGAGVTASPRNLIANGGFEDGGGGIDGRQAGVARFWETICGGPHPEIYALDSKIRRSGRFSQRMSSQGFNQRFTEDGAYCFHVEQGKEVRHPAGTQLGFQAIAQTTKEGAIRPGRTYDCSVWVKIDDLKESWEWFRLGIYWLDADRKFISEVREDHETSKRNYGTHDWKRIRVSAVAPANAAFAKVYLHHHFVHGTVWYDDVQLVEAQPQSR